MGKQAANADQSKTARDGIVRRSIDIAVKSIDKEKRTVDVIASTDSIDGHGDIVEQTFDLSRYKKNPVVLWNHGPGWFCSDPDAEIPIGKAEKFGLKDGQLEATIRFASAAVTPLAEQVWQGFCEDIIRAVSIGFRPGAITEEMTAGGGSIFHLAENELFEISVVPIGSNPDAVAKAIESERASWRERLSTTNKAALSGEGKHNMDIEALKKSLESANAREAELRTELGAARQKAADAEAQNKSLTEQVTKLNQDLTAEKSLSEKASKALDDANTRAKTAEAQLVEHTIGEFVGKKITPAERDEYVDLAKSVGIERVKTLLSKRGDLSITQPVSVEGQSVSAARAGESPAPAPVTNESVTKGAGAELVELANKAIN